jgi:anaerobic ribonucleoside-triphosphate reductase activating protein
MSLGQRPLEGVTISGGEPFDQATGLHELLSLIREDASLGEVDVLVYSGYSLNRLRRCYSAVLDLIDVVVSGPYIVSRPTELPWRGSSNQRLTALRSNAAVKYATVTLPNEELQVSTDGGQLWITGIPRPGTLDELEALLLARGVRIGEVSWRA